MRERLIPTKISHEKRISSQKKNWNSFWKNKLVQPFINLARKFNVFIEVNGILKKYRHCDEFCEVGCGSSILILEVSKTAKKVIGIDYSEEAINLSRKMLKKNKVSNFELIKGDIRCTKVKETYDIVHSNGLIEHFENPGKIIYNHLLLTKKGGYCIIEAPYKHSFKYIWYNLSRPKLLRWIWLWTDQLFFTPKSLEKQFKKYTKNLRLSYKVKVSHLTADVVIIIHKQS